jgi:hypothetical protein
LNSLMMSKVALVRNLSLSLSFSLFLSLFQQTEMH